MEIPKLTLGRIVLFSAALFAVAYTIRGVLKTGGAYPALMLIPLLALLLPMLRDKIKQKIPVWPGTWWSVGLGAFLWLIQMGMFNDVVIANRDADQRRLEKESAARVEKIKQDRLNNYRQNRESILSEINRLTEEGKFKEALQIANAQMSVVQDPDLVRLQSRADIALMRQEAIDPKGVGIARRVKIFETLSKEDPTNAAYAAGLKEAQELLAIQQKMEATARNRQALEASVHGQFSGFDGSHRAVESAIKARMRDPSSYEHIETRYSVGSESITVYTRYRGKNGFGGLAVGAAIAEVNASGQVLSLNIE